MDVLLTFVGNRDPFVEEDYPSSNPDGPVLSLLAERSYDAVHLFTTRSVLLNANALRREMKSRGLGPVRQEDLEVADPTAYEELLPQMWRAAERVRAGYPNDTSFWIATSSGTPQMHASWLVLALSRRFPGRLLKVTPRRFLKPGQPAVSELFPEAPLFSVALEETGPAPARRRAAALAMPCPTAPAGAERPELEFPLAAASAGDPELLRVENEKLRRALQAERGDAAFSRLVGWDGSLRQVVETAGRIAGEEVTVLLRGETGTGKELMARCIHDLSPWHDGPFVAVNCGALPEHLAESLLFGHRRGAFTGALRDEPGFVGRAEGGTLFLDEIGDLPLSQQVKLLRLMQDKESTPVGGETRRVDLRIVAATNKDLPEEIEAGRFRSDLYYRLGIHLTMPPLRDRPQDVAILAVRFVEKLNADRPRPKRLAAETVELLQAQEWPGNVRELENILTKIYYTCPGEAIGPDCVPQGLFRSRRRPPDISIPPEGLDLEKRLFELERQYYLKALERTDNNKARAARLLGVHPKTFQKACREKFGL